MIEGGISQKKLGGGLGLPDVRGLHFEYVCAFDDPSNDESVAAKRDLESRFECMIAEECEVYG